MKNCEIKKKKRGNFNKYRGGEWKNFLEMKKKSHLCYLGWFSTETNMLTITQRRDAKSESKEYPARLELTRNEDMFVNHYATSSPMS